MSGQEFEMQDLRLIGVQEDGQHLLLAAADGTHFRVALDEPLRAAARHDRPRLGQLQIEMDGGMRPREVQSLIRAGATAEEVADRSGWSVDKVGRYEGPILAERVHVADQARQVRVRSRGGATGSTVPTLQGRVAQRMRERGVDPETNAWDSWRGVEDTLWTVVLTFAAGGRQRQASWTYDPVLRTVEAGDDEARWLSADEPAAMGPLPTTTARVSNVYDVEAEGGVAATARRTGAAARAGHEEEPLDLMTAMRQRTTVGRRSGRRRAASEPARHEVAPALPLESEPAVEALLPVEPEPVSTQHAPEAEARPAVVSEEEPARDLLDRVAAHDEVEPPDESDPEVEPAGSEIPPLDDDPADDPSEEPADHEEVAPEAPDAPDTEPTPVRPEATTKAASRRRQRPTVPSWDDIMFGAKRD